MRNNGGAISKSFGSLQRYIPSYFFVMRPGSDRIYLVNCVQVTEIAPTLRQVSVHTHTKSIDLTLYYTAIGVNPGRYQG